MKPWPMQQVAKSIIIGLCGVFFLGCSENGSNAQSSPASSPTILASDARPLPAELEEGEEKFNEFCSRCHGPQGQGTNIGLH